MKETIPILSSCLSGGLILMASLVSVLLIALLDYESDLKPMISRGFLILVMSVHIPLILWITVKNQKKNKKPVAPAKTLQFHGVSSKWAAMIIQKKVKNIFFFFFEIGRQWRSWRNWTPNGTQYSKPNTRSVCQQFFCLLTYFTFVVQNLISM